MKDKYCIYNGEDPGVLSIPPLGITAVSMVVGQVTSGKKTIASFTNFIGIYCYKMSNKTVVKIKKELSSLGAATQHADLIEKVFNIFRHLNDRFYRLLVILAIITKNGG